MIVAIDVFTSKGELINSDAMIADEDINIDNIDKVFKYFRLSDYDEIYRDIKLLIKIIKEHIPESRAYIYDYTTKTVYREYINKTPYNLLDPYSYNRIDLPTTGEYKYKAGDHVKYRHDGCICTGTIGGEVVTYYNPKMYWIDEDDYEGYHYEIDPMQFLGNMFYNDLDMIHQDDIIELV